MCYRDRNDEPRLVLLFYGWVKFIETYFISSRRFPFVLRVAMMHDSKAMVVPGSTEILKQHVDRILIGTQGLTT